MKQTYSIAKRFHRIQTHGGTRRQVAGNEAHHEQNQRHQSEAGRIVRGNAMEASGQQLGQEIGADEPDREAAQDEPKTLAGDQPQHVARLRAKRHAHSDLLRPLPDGIRHYAIDTERGEEQRQAGKDGKERCQKIFDPRTIARATSSMVKTR